MESEDDDDFDVQSFGAPRIGEALNRAVSSQRTPSVAVPEAMPAVYTPNAAGGTPISNTAASSPTSREWLTSYTEGQNSRPLDFVNPIVDILEAAGLLNQQQVLDYQSTDASLKTLKRLSKKQKQWLQVVIAEARLGTRHTHQSVQRDDNAELPPAEVTQPSGPDHAQEPAQSNVDTEPLLQEVAAVQTKTKMTMLKVDGNSKHDRFFWVNPSEKTISWSEKPEFGRKAKTERLSTVTDSITACNVKPKYAHKDFTIGTEENTQLLLVADSPQTKQLWVEGCQAVINGQITSAMGAVPVSELEPNPVPEPEPEPEQDPYLQPEPQLQPQPYPETSAAAAQRVSFMGGPPLVQRLGESVRSESNTALSLTAEAALDAPTDEVLVPTRINANGVLDLTRGFSLEADGPLDDGLGPSPRIVEDSLFGQPVESMRRPKAPQYNFLPAAIHELTDWLQTNAASVQGLFSRPVYEDASDQGVALLRNLLDEGSQGENHIEFMQHRPQTVAGVLKAWLRDMPEPLLTTQLFDEWVTASNATSRPDCVERVTKLVAKLPLANCEILDHLTTFLVQHSITSHTATRDIAGNMTPLLLWSEDEDLPLEQVVEEHRADMICVLLEERDKIFSRRARHPVRRAAKWSQIAADNFVREAAERYGKDSVIVHNFVGAMRDYSNDRIDGEGLVRTLCSSFPDEDRGFVCRVVDKFLPSYVKEIGWIQTMLHDVDTDDEDTPARPHQVRLLEHPDHFEQLVRENGQEQAFYQIVMEEVAARKIQALVRGVLSRKKIRPPIPRDYLASLVVTGVKPKPYTYYMGTSKVEVTIGRKTKHAADVDVDVSFAGDTKQSKISRVHATIRYDSAANQFTLRCVAQRKKQHLVVDGMVLTSHDNDYVIGESRSDSDEPNEIRIGDAVLYFTRKGTPPPNLPTSDSAIRRSAQAPSDSAATRAGLLPMPISRTSSTGAAVNTTHAPQVLSQKPMYPILAAADGFQEDCEKETAPYLATLEADDGSVYYMDRAEFVLGRDSASARGEGGPNVLLAHCGSTVSRLQLRIWYHMEGDSDTFVVENLGRRSIKVYGLELKQGDQPIELPSRSHLEVGSVTLVFKNKFDVQDDKAATVIQKAVRNRWTAQQLERQSAIIRQAELEQYGWWAKNLSKATATASQRVQQLDGDIESSKLQQQREQLQSDEQMAKLLTQRLKQLELKRANVHGMSNSGVASIGSPGGVAVETQKELDAFGEKYIYNNQTGEATHIGEQAARLIQRVYRGHKTREKYLYDGTVYGALAERQIMVEEIKAAWFGYLEMKEQRRWFLNGGEEPTGEIIRAWEGWNSVKLDRIAGLPRIYIQHARDAGWNVPEPKPKFLRQAEARQAKRLAKRSLEQHPDPEVQKEAQLNREEEQITARLQQQVDELEAKQRSATARMSELPPDRRTDPQGYREWLLAAQQTAQITAAQQQLAQRISSNHEQLAVPRAETVYASLDPEPEPALKPAPKVNHNPKVEPEPELEPEPQTQTQTQAHPEPEPALHFSRRSPRQKSRQSASRLSTPNPESVLPLPTLQQTMAPHATESSNTRRPKPRVDTGRLMGLRTTVQQQTAEMVSLMRSQIDAIASASVEAEAGAATPPDKRTDPEGYRRFLVSTQQAAIRASGASSDPASVYAAAGTALRASPAIAQQSPRSCDDDDETESDTESIEEAVQTPAKHLVGKEDGDKQDDDKQEKVEEEEQPEALFKPATGNGAKMLAASVGPVGSLAATAPAPAPAPAVVAPVVDVSAESESHTSVVELKREANVAGPEAKPSGYRASEEKLMVAHHPEEDPDLTTDEDEEHEDEDSSDNDGDGGGTSDVAEQLEQLEQLHRAGHIDAEELAQYRAVLLAEESSSDSERDDDEKPRPPSRRERPPGNAPQHRAPRRKGRTGTETSSGRVGTSRENLSWS